MGGRPLFPFAAQNRLDPSQGLLNVGNMDLEGVKFPRIGEGHGHMPDLGGKSLKLQDERMDLFRGSALLSLEIDLLKISVPMVDSGSHSPAEARGK